MHVYNPASFDPYEVLPRHLHRYADDARYFVHKIFEHRVFDHRKKDAYVPLKARYLLSVMSERRFFEIRDALVAGGAIEMDNHYVKGQKSYGYRLSEKHRNSRHVRIAVRNARLVRKILQRKAEMLGEISLDVHQHLYRFLVDITIDYEAAVLDVDDDDLVVNEMAISMIRDGHWFFHFDEYGRVHTNVSNLKSCFRKHLRYKGLRLANVDIRNSQPLFLGILLLQFYANGGSASFYSLPNLPDSLPLPLRSDISTPPDVGEYISLAQSGRLYDYIADRVGDEQERKELKRRLFRELFFCRNRKWQTACEKAFEGAFPNVYAFIRKMKSRDYTQLSKLLQKTESAFIINGVVRDCMERHPDMFVTTIHDSVMVAADNVPCIESLIRSRFSLYGIQPTLKVE